MLKYWFISQTRFSDAFIRIFSLTYSTIRRFRQWKILRVLKTLTGFERQSDFLRVLFCMEIRNSLKELLAFYYHLVARILVIFISYLWAKGISDIAYFHYFPHILMYQLMESLSFQKIEDKSSDISDESEEISKYLTIHWGFNSRFQDEVNI